jgi:excisionase family DNA binding protein
MNRNDKEFLTIKEFAAKLGVHWFTVWRWTTDRRIAFRQAKAGGKILIPATELYRLHAAEALGSG